MSAAFARKIVYIDAPMAILGRTHKSFGSNVVLCNSGKKREEIAADYGLEFECAPLRTMAFPNLMCDGILGAKRVAPEMFTQYNFDEAQYLKGTMQGLRRLRERGIDVEADVAELLEYASKYPGLRAELGREKPVPKAQDVTVSRIRTLIGDLGARTIHERFTGFRQYRKLRRGEWRKGTISGSTFGFQDILGCAEFLTPLVSRSVSQERGA
jgi:hypothetical protein